MTPAQQDKFEEFTAIREAVGKTTWLSSIFDETWFKEALPKIMNSSPPGMVAADSNLFFHSLPHPLLDASRFEAAIALLDLRLEAFAELPFKRKHVTDKLKLLRIARSNRDLKNHFFEINVLGDLALKNVLSDIEVLPDIEKSKSCVDGIIDLAGRQIFLELTNTTHEVIPQLTGTTRVMTVNPDREIDQIVEKLRKKVAKNKQLALAKGSPTVLFLARTYNGADRHSAEIGVNECFHVNEFADLSGVVLADSWKFQVTSWHPGVTPDTPLTEAEERKLRSWYAKGNVAA